MSVRVVPKAVLINSEGSILCLRRSQTDPLRPGAIDFPGGGVEDGEDLLEGLVREIREETGLTIASNALSIAYSKTSQPNNDGHIIMRLLCIGHLRDQDIQVSLSYEHDAYSWVKPKETLGYFDNEVWREGLEFLLAHELLA